MTLQSHWKVSCKWKKYNFIADQKALKRAEICPLNFLYSFYECHFIWQKRDWGFTMSQDSYKLTRRQFKWVFFPQLGYLSPCWCFIIKLCPILAMLWTVAHKAPLSMGFSRQEYWSGLLFLLPGDLPNPGIKPGSPAIGRWILYHWATWEA